MCKPEVAPLTGDPPQCDRKIETLGGGHPECPPTSGQFWPGGITPCARRVESAWDAARLEGEGPAYWLDGAPAASNETLHGYLSGRRRLGRESPRLAGLRFRASPFVPYLHFILEPTGLSAGAVAPQIDGIPGCGEAGVPSRAQRHLGRRFGAMKLEEMSSADVGIGLRQEKDSPVTVTQDKFTDELELMPTSPELWAAFGLGDAQLSMQAGRTQLASYFVSSMHLRLPGESPTASENECSSADESWQPQAAPKSCPGLNAVGHTFEGWSDAAYGDQTTGVRGCLGHPVAPLPSPLRETCHVLHWPPRRARQTVKNSLYGEVYAFRKLAKHMGLLREFYASFLYVAPGMGAMEDF